MTMQHGTQPTRKKAKATSDGDAERKRGVKPTLPPRDGTTRTAGVSKKHQKQDRYAKQKEGGLRKYEDKGDINDKV